MTDSDVLAPELPVDSIDAVAGALAVRAVSKRRRTAIKYLAAPGFLSWTCSLIVDLRFVQVLEVKQGPHKLTKAWYHIDADLPDAAGRLTSLVAGTLRETMEREGI